MEDRNLYGEMLAGWAKSITLNGYKNNGCLTVEELILLLESVDEDKPITFLDGSFLGDLDSYRGSYSELAIGFEEGTPTTQETVGEFSKRLRNKVGKTIYGYKGGEYKVHYGTTVHKANYGECGDIVVGIRENEESVDILTRDEDADKFEEELSIKSKLKELRDSRKVVKPEEWKADFLIDNYGNSVGTTEIKQSEEKVPEPTCEITSYGSPAWGRFKLDDRMQETFPNLIELVDEIRAIGDRIDVVSDKDYTLTSLELSKEINKMYMRRDALQQLCVELWSDENRETSALGKELEAYAGAFCATVIQLWCRFEKIKNVSKDDIKDFYMFLENIGTEKLAGLMENRLVTLWGKGEL